jgi:glucokinase
MTARPRPRRLVLGLDVGGTKLAAGVLDLDASARDDRAVLLSRRDTPSHREQGPDAMLDRLIALGQEALAAAGASVPDLGAVGIACGGPLDPVHGVIRSPMNLPDWHDVPIVARVESALGVRAAVDNDGTAAALAEHRFGAGRGHDDLVYFTISTGIGGGVISGGRAVRGASGNATELGHLRVAPVDHPCACGRRGCLEGFASGTNIAERARAAIRAGESSALASLAGGPDAITAENVVQAAAGGDALATRIWNESIEAIGAGVVDAIHAFDPSVVILGGGVTRAGEALFAPVRRHVADQGMRPEARGVPVVPAALGDDLGIVAAAMVAVDRFGLAIGGGAHQDVADHLRGAEAVRALLPDVGGVGERLITALARGGRVVAFGNGGSAADAQHLAAELVGHFRRDRAALPALALTTDPSVVTAIANDFDWDDVFARQVEAQVRPGDVVIAISTSGEAENVIRGVLAARTAGAETVALTGGTGGRLAGEVDLALAMPATTTARIQELHGLVIHLLSDQVDAWAAGETVAADSTIAPPPGRTAT